MSLDACNSGASSDVEEPAAAGSTRDIQCIHALVRVVERVPERIGSACVMGQPKPKFQIMFHQTFSFHGY